MYVEYGPIIKINPYELYRWHTDQFGHPHSSANTVEHNLHKLRTSATAPYFSRGNILRLEQEVIQETFLKLCKRIDEFHVLGQPMLLGVAYRAFTTDIISKYTMATSFEFLDIPDFNKILFKEFLENIVPIASQLIHFHHVVKQQVAKTANAEVKIETESESIPTVFYEMAHNEKVPAEEKSLDRLTNEGVLFIVAGNETIGTTLSIITFYILRFPCILVTLYVELVIVVSDKNTVPLWRHLETLPYLSAVIKEGLRMSYDIVSRMSCVSPSAPLRYKDWIIPPNTPVSINIINIHNNVFIFVDPKSFIPDCWLRSDERELMQKLLVPFFRGTRACVGMKLAYAELYVTLATLFRRYKIILFKMGEVDIEVQCKYYIPRVGKGLKGVRVLVKK